MTKSAGQKVMPKGGSRKGVPNKNTKAIKDMIEGALSAVGGQKYLEQQAIENPVAFMGLVGKILPKDVNANVDIKIDYAAELLRLREIARNASGN